MNKLILILLPFIILGCIHKSTTLLVPIKQVIQPIPTSSIIGPTIPLYLTQIKNPQPPVLTLNKISNRKIRVVFVDAGRPAWNNPFLKKYTHIEMGIEKYPKHFDHATQVISAFLIELERSIPNASELVEIIYCPLPMYPGKNDDHSVLENDCLKRISHMKIDYLNLSIEGINPDPEEQLNLSKISESTIITVAAGNSGTNIKSYPCSYEMKNKVCVGNVGPNFKIHKTSTRNAEVNVYELGVNVLVYISTSLQLYETSGTSFSAPLHLAHLIRDAQLGRIYDYKTSIQKFKIANSLAAPQRVPAGLDK